MKKMYSVVSSLCLIHTLGFLAGCVQEPKTPPGSTSTATPTAPPQETAIEIITITAPSSEMVINSQESTLTFSGTKQAYTGVWITQEVSGTKVVDKLAISQSEQETWSYEVTLQEVEGDPNNTNTFRFIAYLSESKESQPIQVKVQYKPETTNEPEPETNDGSAPLTQESNAFNSIKPRVARGGNGVIVAVWQQCSIVDTCNKTTIIGSRYTQDIGWATPVEISPISDNSANAQDPDVAVDSQGMAHIVWTDSGSIGSRPGDSDIVYRTWDGNSLSAPQTPSNANLLGCANSTDCAGVGAPRIALHGDEPRIVFQAAVGSVQNSSRQYEIFLAEPSAAGWAQRQLSEAIYDELNTSRFGSTTPTIAIEQDGTAVVVWQNQRTASASDLHYRFVKPTTLEALGVATSCVAGMPQEQEVAFDKETSPETIHMVWKSPAGCIAETSKSSIAYAKSSNSGVMEASVTVSDDTSAGDSTHQHPAMVMRSQSGGSQIALSWATDANLGAGDGFHVVLKQKSNQGAWGLLTALSGATEESAGSSPPVYPSEAPAVAADGAHLVICWQEQENTTNDSDFDIRCVRRGW